MAQSKRPAADPASKNFNTGLQIVRGHGLFQPMLLRANVLRSADARYPQNGWAYVNPSGRISVHPTRLATSEEWAWVLAHCCLHLGLNHFQLRFQQVEWDAACDCIVHRFLGPLKIGRPPLELSGVSVEDLPARNEETLYRHFCERGIPKHLQTISLTGTRESDMIEIDAAGVGVGVGLRAGWERVFAEGLRMAVMQAVESAGPRGSRSRNPHGLTVAARARNWFVSSYPLLGSLAAAFDLIEDQLVCHRMEIGVAAVNAYTREIFINPAAGLSEQECRFVIAHELLHVALEHQKRRCGRDPEFWNVACDYIINGWLIEMGIGKPPAVGLLHDPELAQQSAESLYDQIVRDLRRFRKLRTFRGIGTQDMLENESREWWRLGDGVDLDEFYRRCLAQGFQYHCDGGRGLLPAALVEEIRALSQPPIPWDVKLAQWFDHHFPPRDRRQSYARMSRRQSVTPDIPRPRWVPAALDPDRTFGVVIDTSGSMNRTMLADALGAVASYSQSREVGAVRVVFCDAAAYDKGYMAPEEIAGRVEVKGRGGTVLQPGIDLLERAADFPKDGPILIVTDGFCDQFETNRKHAILLPAGRTLPMPPKGDVFFM